MNNKKLNNLKEKYILLKKSQNKIQNKIQKSILQNNEINLLTKTIFFKKNKINKKRKNICLTTGRYRGLIKNFNASRHVVKEMIIKNQIHN
jgi:ribosomal protein S14